MNIRKVRGYVAEDHACKYVIEKGWEILTRNYTCRGAELDLVAKQGRVIAIIEVKYRHSRTSSTLDSALHRALLSIDQRKQKKLIKGAQMLLSQYPHYAACTLRFDLIAVTLNSTYMYTCQWIPNIFNLTDVYDA